MKDITPQLQTHLSGEVSTLASCVKLIFTKHPVWIDTVTNANPGVVTTRWAHQLASGS